MQYSLDAMTVALRVLTAINDRRDPDSADLEKLRELAGRGRDQTDPDALACEVIRKAVRHRERVRNKGFSTWGG